MGKRERDNKARAETRLSQSVLLLCLSQHFYISVLLRREKNDQTNLAV